MSQTDKFTFKRVYTPAGVPDNIGTIAIEEIQKMTMPEFLAFEGQLVNVRRRKRRDVAVCESDSTIVKLTEKQLFRKGVGEQETYFTSATEYTKDRFHTNMTRGGNFGEGSLTIVTSIEAHVAETALKATTKTAGAVTNPLGAAVANSDPGLVVSTVGKQFEVAFYKGEDLIIDGLVEEFPQMTAISGVAGAAVGALFQNAGFQGNYLNNPIVLKNDEDFHISLKALAALNLTTATGLTLNGLNIGIKINTIELRRVNP